MLSLIFISILSIVIGLIIYHFWNRSKVNQKVKQEAHILLEQVRKVCKLVTVEGEFQEILDTRNEKSVLFNLITQQKKAIVIVKAKALVGYDLSQLDIKINDEEKKILISNFPKSDLISLETDLNYYDITNRMLNRFSEQDLSELNIQAKSHIVSKVEESQLHSLAQKQGEEIIDLIGEIGLALGWSVVKNPEIEHIKTKELPE